MKPFMDRALAALESNIFNRTGVADCARCGGLHDTLYWKTLDNPDVSAPEGAKKMAIIGYAMCPVTGQPILYCAWDSGE